jgi:hypothetical protein
MRWVLPGGAVLGGKNRREARRVDEAQEVACRPLAAALERMRSPSPWRRLRSKATRLVGLVVTFFSVERLTTAKLVLEVLAVLVGLIGGILVLLGVLRK